MLLWAYARMLKQQLIFILICALWDMHGDFIVLLSHKSQEFLGQDK